MFSDPVCLDVKYNHTAIGDASILITFYNEPLSTLLRTVHSVLNLTPPPMLREIILIDDHSDSAANRPGGPLDDYVRHLPKVKLVSFWSDTLPYHAMATHLRSYAPLQ